MVEIFGSLFLLSASMLWVIVAGGATNTRLQSLSSLVIYSLLNFGVFVGVGLYEDQLTYFSFGQKLAEAILRDPFSADSGWTPGGQSYVWLVALMFLVFGESVWPLLSLSVLFMVMLPAIFVWVGRNLGFTSDGSLNAWLAVIAPPFLLWGHGVNKEPLVFLLLALGLLGASQIYRGRFFRGCLTVLCSAVLMSFTRNSLLSVLAVLVVVLLSLRIINSKRRFGQIRTNALGRTVLASASVVLTIAFVLLLGAGVDSRYWQEFGRGIPELSGPGQSTAIPGASWEHNSSINGIATNLGKSLFGPMPWEATNLPMAFFAIEGLMYFVLAYLLLLAAVMGGNQRKTIVALTLSALPLILAATLLLANYGLNSRLRAHTFLLLLVACEPAAISLWEKIRGRPSAKARIGISTPETSRV